MCLRACRRTLCRSDTSTRPPAIVRCSMSPWSRLMAARPSWATYWISKITELAWQSITTGGLSGAIIELNHPTNGTLKIDTLQKQCCCDLKTIGLKPKIYKAGGLRKQIEVSRLPDKRKAPVTFEFELPISNKHDGDNPIYVRLLQEDGHMAWSSPIYIVQ